MSAESTTTGSRPSAQAEIEELGLLAEADVVERRVLALGRVAGHHPRRMADQEQVAHLAQPVAADARQHVLGHVLVVAQRPAAGGQTGRNHLFRVCFLRGQDLVAQRVVDAGGGQIGGIERLVDHRAIAARGEGIHQRGGQVPRAGPAGDDHLRPTSSGAAPAGSRRTAPCSGCRFTVEPVEQIWIGFGTFTRIGPITVAPAISCISLTEIEAECRAGITRIFAGPVRRQNG